MHTIAVRCWRRLTKLISFSCQKFAELLGKKRKKVWRKRWRCEEKKLKGEIAGISWKSLLTRVLLLRLWKYGLNVSSSQFVFIHCIFSFSWCIHPLFSPAAYVSSWIVLKTERYFIDSATGLFEFKVMEANNILVAEKWFQNTYSLFLYILLYCSVKNDGLKLFKIQFPLWTC